MARRFAWRVTLGVAILVVLGGCSTLAVRVPPGMFVSTSHFVPGVRTLGVVQAKKTVIAPLILFVNINKVRQGLYEELIGKAREAGATGVTDISFSWMPSPWTFLSAVLATAVIDFTIEGFAVVEK
jgi:hypothetical protein